MVTSADITDFDEAVRRVVNAMNAPGVVATKVTATPGDNSITLAWGDPTGTVTGFRVTRNGPPWNTVVAATSRSFVFTNFSAGTTYQVSIAALLADGSTGTPVAVNVKMPGDVVTDPGGGGTTTTGTQPYPAKAVALYLMCWTNSGSPKVATIPTGVNVLLLAFAQGDPPKMVGPASDGATFGAELKKLRARGVRIILSIGGAGGAVNIANHDAFVNGVMAINDTLCPLDGLDFDLEGAAMGQADVLAVSAALKSKRGTNFAITLAPNGSNIGSYQPIAVALQKAGNLTAMGQQFYDAVVSVGAATGRIDQAVAAGIPVSKYQVGMMVGDADTYWTVDECLANYKTIKAKYPTIGGAYLWEASRAGTADWVTRVGAVIKS